MFLGPRRTRFWLAGLLVNVKCHRIDLEIKIYKMYISIYQFCHESDIYSCISCLLLSNGATAHQQSKYHVQDPIW